MTQLVENCVFNFHGFRKALRDDQKKECKVGITGLQNINIISIVLTKLFKDCFNRSFLGYESVDSKQSNLTLTNDTTE